MSMRELTHGEVEACRANATRKVTDFIAKLPSGISESDRLEKLASFFNMKARCTNMLVENFDPDNFHERENHLKPPGELNTLMRGAVEGVETLNQIVSHMAESPLSRVNGTSVAFLDCADASKIFSDRLAVARRIYETNGACQQIQHRTLFNSALAHMTTGICQIMMLAIFLPDAI